MRAAVGPRWCRPLSTFGWDWCGQRRRTGQGKRKARKCQRGKRGEMGSPPAAIASIAGVEGIAQRNGAAGSPLNPKTSSLEWLHRSSRVRRASAASSAFSLMCTSQGPTRARWGGRSGMWLLPQARSFELAPLVCACVLVWRVCSEPCSPSSSSSYRSWQSGRRVGGTPPLSPPAQGATSALL
jgi:hypothetical protein